jgi:hypothetical protein
VDKERTSLFARSLKMLDGQAVLQSHVSIPNIKVWLQSLEVRLVAAILLLAFVRGLVYIVVVPPWEHYDEPTHFEYAALFNILGQRPGPDEVDRALRFEIARSVAVHTPWRLKEIPIDTGNNPLPDIGIVQVGHPPLYYMMASIPLRFTASLPIETQLYTMRAFSLLLYLLALLLSAVLSAMLLPNLAALRIASLSIIVAVPPFTRLMTAASNDSMVVLVGVLLLLMAVLIVQQGWSWKSLLLLALGFMLPFVTKRTIFVLSLVPLLAFVLIVPRLWRRRIIYSSLGLMALGLLILFMMPHGASYWLNKTGGRLMQTTNEIAHTGSRAIMLTADDEENRYGFAQTLSPLDVVHLPREELTVGIWARSLEGEIKVGAARVSGTEQMDIPTFTVGEEWQFIWYRVRMERRLDLVEVRFPAPQTGTIIYDDAVAVFGDYRKATQPPVPLDKETLQWEGAILRNYFANPSFETDVPIITAPKPLMNRVQTILPFGTLDLLMSSLGDFDFIWSIYPKSAAFLFKSFWLIIDSGMPNSVIDFWMTTIMSLGLASLLGWAWMAIRHAMPQLLKRIVEPTFFSDQQTMVWDLVWCAVCLAWGVALIRTHLQPPWPAFDYTFPIGRYAYAALVPTVLLMVMGLGLLVPKRWHLWLCAALVFCFFSYDLYAIANKVWYHYVLS